jgi:vancomycin resistance protein YoaR
MYTVKLYKKGGKMVKFKKQAWVLAALLALTFIIPAADYLYHRQRIYGGVYMEEIDLGGKTGEEARHILEEYYSEDLFSARPVRLFFGAHSWTVTQAQLGIAPDLDAMVSIAMGAGREKAAILSYARRLRMLRTPQQLKPRLSVNIARFGASLSQPGEELYVEPVDARLELSPDRMSVEIIADIPGRSLDARTTLERLEALLQEEGSADSLELAVKPVAAAISHSFLDSLQIREPVATFTTSFSRSDSNRNHNIALAARAIDGILLLPEDIFSFNETVGDTTEDKGYRKAPIIVGGRFEDGLGGGICQVSSTLYNAVLLADLAVAERKNHGLAVGYLPPGRDATIAYGWIDLRFVNDRHHGIWVRTWVEGGRLTVTLYGQAIPGHAVEVVSRDLTTIPAGEKTVETPELPRGTRELVSKGQPGYRVTTWRISYLHGEEVRREM